MAGVVQLVPIGKAARELVKELAEPLQAELGVFVVLAPSLGDPKYAFNKDRNQYHSTAILRRLLPLRTSGQMVLGVTEVDLFVPDRPFVFGEADRESKAALVSLARLRPEFGGGARNNDLLRLRARTEAVHEAGHLVGLSHCDDLRCVMYFSESVGDTDRKGASLCSDCRSELDRLQRVGA